MDIAFRGLLGECVVVYLHNVTIFSKNKEDHISHLEKVFNQCRKYNISLNPKKSIFFMDEGLNLTRLKRSLRSLPLTTKNICSHSSER
jgi:hypothetical protein